jgi:hypothetical protein
MVLDIKDVILVGVAILLRYYMIRSLKYKSYQRELIRYMTD